MDVIRRLQKLDLDKKPGLSELIDWVGYSQMVGMSARDLEEDADSGILLKGRSDQQRARKGLNLQ